MTAISCRAHIGGSSLSARRSSRLYGGCSHTPATPRWRASAWASATIHAGNVDVPIHRTFPASTNSPSTPSVSSMGTTGDGRCNWYRSMRSVRRLRSDASHDATMCSRRCQRPGSPSPRGRPTLVARSTSSRRPVRSSTSPTTCSLSPYTSAVSTRSMPASSARASIAAASSGGVAMPKFMAPSVRGATSTPVVPKGLRVGVLPHLHRPGDGAAHDELLVLRGHGPDHLAVLQRIAHAFRVREVGTEHEPVGREPDVEQALRVGLVEDVDVDGALHRLERVLVEEHQRLLVGP